MKKSRLYGGIVSFCLVVLAAAGISTIGLKKDAENQNNTSEIVKDEPHKEVVVNNTPPFYTTSVENVKNVDDIEDTVENNEVSTENQSTETEATEPEKEVFLESEDYTETSVVNTEDPLFKYPAAGEIVMDYSIDKAIFDITLEQYRTNDSISIGAAKGSDVTASADGTVSKIYTDIENGTTVVIDHKNGWQTTYSQLEKDTAVSEGDTVTSGQKIGVVATPSSYSVLLGDHIDFSVAQNGESVDPKLVLAE